MSNSEILAVAKILLESRAFTKEEMDSILNKLVEECVPLKICSWSVSLLQMKIPLCGTSS